VGCRERKNPVRGGSSAHQEKKMYFETRSEPALQEGLPPWATGVSDSDSAAVASTRASPVPLRGSKLRAASPTGEGRS